MVGVPRKKLVKRLNQEGAGFDELEADEEELMGLDGCTTGI